MNRDGDLGRCLEADGFAPTEGPGSIADVTGVRALLVAAARGGKAVSYSELLQSLGHRFTRKRGR